MDGRNRAPLGDHGKPLFVGIYMGITIPEFLRSTVGPSPVGHLMVKHQGLGEAALSSQARGSTHSAGRGRGAAGSA